MKTDPALRFAAAALAWLLAAAGLGFWLAEAWAVPVRALSEWGLGIGLPGLVAGVERQGALLEIVTRVAPAASPAATLTFGVNPLAYGYGIPLYAALVLAMPGAPGPKAARLAAGLALLLPAQALGVCLEVGKVLAFDLASETRRIWTPSTQGRELVGLGYQFGVLILPGLAPVVLWMGMHAKSVARLAPGFRAVLREPPC